MLIQPAVLKQVSNGGPQISFLLQALLDEVDAVWTAPAERPFLELRLLMQDCRIERHASLVGETESGRTRQNFVCQDTDGEHVSLEADEGGDFLGREGAIAGLAHDLRCHIFWCACETSQTGRLRVDFHGETEVGELRNYGVTTSLVHLDGDVVGLKIAV